MQFSECFHAMGTDVDVLIEADAPPIDALLSVRLLFENHDALYSRFRPTSLLSQLNRGEPVEHPGFATACRLALAAHDFTEGIFNPMVLPALMDAGYDRTFEAVSGGCPREQSVPDPRLCLVIEGATVRLREGAFDLGGVVKGWTVDLAIELLGDRVQGALVNAGGDLRSTGSVEGANGWLVEIDTPAGGTAWKGTLDGALATSTMLQRSWRTETGTAHHLIDPRTGLPSTGPAAQVSIWGPDAWRAECWAKAVLIAGDELAERARASGFDVLALALDGSSLFGNGRVG